MESAVAYNRVDLPSKATYGESNTKQDYESGKILQPIRMTIVD